MPRNDPFKSILRALDVLELVGTFRNGLQWKFIEKMLGPRTGALHTLLQTLVERGYLTRLEHPIRYVLGPALQTVDRRRDHDVLAQQVGPIMIDICRQSGMKVMYQKFVANNAVILLCVRPERHLVVEQCEWYGATYGTGVIFQAYQTPQEQDRCWAAHPMLGTYQRLWGNLDNLRQYIKIAAKQRLAIIDSRGDHRFRVAGPVLDSNGKAVAALSAVQECSKITTAQAQVGVQLIYRSALKLSSPQSATEIPAAQSALFSGIERFLR